MLTHAYTQDSSKTREEAEAHMDAGKHVRLSDLDCESVYDAARKKWADRGGEMHVASGDRQRIAFEEAGPSSTRERRNIGWALKSTKRTSRMEEKVKAFLAQKFNQGVAGRQKADPIHVAREVKSVARDSRGKLQFKPDEWRTAQQISNLYARMSALQRQRQADEIESQEEEQEVTDEDLIALESEDHIQAIRQEVYRDTEQANSHPIQIEAVNVSELSLAGKLSSLKLAQLREICRVLSLQTNGSNS